MHSIFWSAVVAQLIEHWTTDPEIECVNPLPLCTRDHMYYTS